MIQIFVFLLALFSTPAQAQCNGSFAPNTLCGNLSGTKKPPHSIPVASIATGGASIIGENIVAYGADPTGLTDSTVAIQKAIDAAALQTNTPFVKAVFCPAGNYAVTLPIYLDPPGNLRGADGTNGPAWSVATTYAKGDTVNSGGIAYVSLQNANTANTPVSSPTFWRVFAYNNGTS